MVYTIGDGNGNKLSFSVVQVKHRRDRSALRQVYPKVTWAEQYFQFSRFVPMRCKQGTSRNVFGVQQICSTGTLMEQLTFLTAVYISNGYSEMSNKGQNQLLIDTTKNLELEQRGRYEIIRFPVDSALPWVVCFHERVHLQC